MSEKLFNRQLKNEHVVAPTMLQDSLYNASKQNIRFNTDYELLDVRYAKGVIVGTVAAYMSLGVTFDSAWRMVLDNLPNDVDVECIPPTWEPRPVVDIDILND